MDLKMLFLGKNDEFRIHHMWRDVRYELKKHMEIVEYGSGWTGLKRSRGFEKDLLKLVKLHNPDIIFIDHYFIWENVKETGLPCMMLVNDPHSDIKGITEFINQNRIAMSLNVYRNPNEKFGMDPWKKLLFEGHKQQLFPCCVNIDMFKEYGFEREYDVALLGRTGSSRYPIRSFMKTYLLRGENPNPDGYNIFWRGRTKGTWRVSPQKLAAGNIVARETYAEALARSKMLVFDSSVYKYAVAKYVESMASNTLAVADTPGDAEELHFIPDWNFVNVSRDNVIEKIRYYVENEGERKKIARRGYETVRKHHSHKVRAKQLLGYIEELVSG